MPAGKRASMREGPLAALFRKTAEDADAPTNDPGKTKPEEGQGRRPAPKAAPTGSAARDGERASSRPPVASAKGHGPAKARDSAKGEASARAQMEQRDMPSERQVRSPQERLRNAFSSEVPENMLDHPGGRPSHDTDEDVYARREHAGEGLAAAKPDGGPVLRVVGVGGAGVNAINRMVEAEIGGVEFLAINTDLQSLQQCAAHETLHIGDSITRGLGSGSDPDLGRQAAREEYDRIKAMLRGSDMVFIAAGAGGGTGTGAAPVVAQISRELGALTVAIVTQPFQFEGSRRRDQAEQGVAALAEEVDTLIVVPNNRLLSVLERDTSMVEAFRVADDVLRQGVQGIVDLVTLPGLINLDFADVRTIMSDAGNALLGIGMATGDRRAIDAAEHAVASPLLETSMDGARAILLSITGGTDLTLWEVNEAAKAVAEAAHPDANIIFGAMLDEKLDDQVWVTVVATGYGDGRLRRRGAGQRGLGERNGGDRRSPQREPRGEPKVSRVRKRASESSLELDIPEFIPRR